MLNTIFSSGLGGEGEGSPSLFVSFLLALLQRGQPLDQVQQLLGGLVLACPPQELQLFAGEDRGVDLEALDLALGHFLGHFNSPLAWAPGPLPFANCSMPELHS